MSFIKYKLEILKEKDVIGLKMAIVPTFPFQIKTKTTEQNTKTTHTWGSPPPAAFRRASSRSRALPGSSGSG